jgi:peptidoglycan/LPS O-acetylase OafA/YrhL
MFAPWRWLRLLIVLVPIGIGGALPVIHGCFLAVDSPGSTAGSPYCNLLIFQFPPVRLIEFVAGVLICRMKLRIPQLIGFTAAAAVFCDFVPAMPSFGNDQLLWMLVREVPVISGGGLLIASLARNGWLSRLLSFRPLVIGGEISYSMYLTHQMVILGVLPHTQPGLNLSAKFLLLTVIVIAVSVLLFYFVEAPVRSAVKALLRHERTCHSMATSAAQ